MYNNNKKEKEKKNTVDSSPFVYGPTPTSIASHHMLFCFVCFFSKRAECRYEFSRSISIIVILLAMKRCRRAQYPHRPFSCFLLLVFIKKVPN